MGLRSGPAPSTHRRALGARLPATAAAQGEGAIGAGHVAAIRRFFDQLPQWVDVETQALAEQQLAHHATQFRLEQLHKLADRLAWCLNPDGNFTDLDRARRRRLVLGKQDVYGMSRLNGWLTPEACATVEAVLANGELGQHNGRPATIIVSTTVRELETATGTGLTGDGTRLPINDVIRLATHADHYLAVFDKGRTVALWHAKRLASPGQRIVLHARDRGCSAPGCDVPSYLCEVHYVDDYATCRATDMDNLTFVCGTHHRLVKPGGWLTRKHANGDTEWIPAAAP